MEGIQNAMESVLSQVYDDLEYIIIDGASTDGTVHIIRETKKKYPDADIKVICEKDDGIYDAMNKGLKIAKGEVIGLLNSDDVYTDNLVLKKVATVFTNPAIKCCYGDLVYVDKNDVNKIVRYWKSCEYKDGLFVKGWAPPHPTFLVRRAIYEKYGIFDLDYKLAADFEIMARFLGRYHIASKYIPKVLVKMRLGGATNRNLFNVIKQNLEIYRAGKKNNFRISLIALIFKKSINRITQFYIKPRKEA